MSKQVIIESMEPLIEQAKRDISEANCNLERIRDRIAKWEAST